MLIADIGGLLTPLVTAHEPASNPTDPNPTLDDIDPALPQGP